MTHEEFYKEVVAVQKMNYGDPADFANDVLALLGKFRVEEAAQQSVQRTAESVEQKSISDVLAEADRDALLSTRRR